ncbi:hypothetical protein SESBI_15856 [Sesbania bispinosa]|nr:hypothetical protein SESBI_15856 [Sesbania bispinosa]
MYVKIQVVEENQQGHNDSQQRIGYDKKMTRALYESTFQYINTAKLAPLIMAIGKCI